MQYVVILQTKEKDHGITDCKLIYPPGVKLRKCGKVDGSEGVRFGTRDVTRG